MRLWGGHGGHPDALFDAADVAGIFVLHEFFMSGDNNGRWAGNASWPLDHRLYSAAAADTVRRLRGHASLFAHLGGNELWPFDASPPRDILAALVATVAALDGATPFIQSSMGANESDFHGFDPLLALAPTDGPYGILDPRSFSLPNPGRRKNFTVAWAFQPEIGSAAHPDADSLARFLLPRAAAAQPGPRSTGVDAVWAWHNYEGFGDDEGGDQLYLLAPQGNSTAPRGATGWAPADYAAAAGLAQAIQYRALFEGYADAMWTRTTGVLMWKSASPWPALRGALYDWFLAPSGGFFGARAALEPLHAQLSRAPPARAASLTVVNRGLATQEALTIEAAAYDLASGARLDDGGAIFALAAAPPGAATRVPLSELAWPAAAPRGAALLWRVTLAHAGAVLSSSEYFLSTLANNATGAPQDLSALAVLRRTPTALTVAAAGAARAGGGALATVAVTAARGGAIAAAVRCLLRDAAAAVAAATGARDDRVLPTIPSDGYFSLLPGETREVSLEAPRAAWPSATLVAECVAWNAPAARATAAPSP